MDARLEKIGDIFVHASSWPSFAFVMGE